MKLDPDLAEGSEDNDGEDEDEDGGLEAGEGDCEFLEGWEEAGMFVSMLSSGEREGTHKERT